MINRTEFQKLAKQFRSGRLNLVDFTDAVIKPESRENIGRSFDYESSIIQLPVRPENSHKGDFGRLLLIGGSAAMPGAIALSAMAALRMGTGLALVVTPEEARSIVAGFSPCLMTLGVSSKDGLFSNGANRIIGEKCDWADVVVVGPGMGRSESGRKIVSAIYHHLNKPVVLDADALNNLAAAQLDLSKHAATRILTPHPGEFCRLANTQFNRRDEMEEAAFTLARQTGTTILLKGHRSVVTDGDRIYRNETGNAGLATAGAGDVLTGIIASMIGQKMSGYESAKSGCCIHGLAADEYAKQHHPASLLATDIIDNLELAISKVKKER